MRPTISIVIPVYNRQELILRCLDSIAMQSYPPLEIIVVDNGSTDATCLTVIDWIEKQKAKKKYRLLIEDKRGATFARQKGLDNAVGDFVLFFDSDDVMNPDLIEKVTNKIMTSPDLDLVCWRCRIHQLDNSVRIPLFQPQKPIENHLIHSLLRTQGYVLKKDFLLKSGGWKKNLPVWNDLELGLRILLLRPKIKYIEEILVDVYAQKNSITGENFTSKEGEWETSLEEMRETVANSQYLDKERILRILNYRKAILAAHYKREGNKTSAKKLMTEVSEKIKFREKLILKISYLYTAAGLRGAWHIARLFLI